MFKVLNSIEKVKSSLLLKEGTVIAHYNRGGLSLELVTTGNPIIEFQGNMYDDVQDFPPELMAKIISGEKKELHIVFGNNYELLVSRDNQYLDNEILPDISGTSDKKLERMMSETALDYAF